MANDAIIRDPYQAASQPYDVIVVGGGIHGACLFWQAARAGLRPLLLERHDFGGQTSWNPLRILHGGLRYLQQADLPRFFQSISARRWFFQHFPQLVAPLPCVLPLYGHGARRPSILRAALQINDRLSAWRNRGVPHEVWIPDSRILTSAQVLAYSSVIPRERLMGGALWFDGLMRNPCRLLIEILRNGCRLGGTALNYCEVDEMETDGRTAVAICAQDRVAKRRHRYLGNHIFYCGGPSSPFPLPRVLAPPALAINVLFDRAPWSEAAVGVSPQGRGNTYFLLPLYGRLLAGTYHVGLDGTTGDPGHVDLEPHVLAFVKELNAAVPALDLHTSDVLRVFSGIMPARRPGSPQPAGHPRIRVHRGRDGPRGLISVQGVKYTTAPLVARMALRAAGYRINCGHRDDFTESPPNIIRTDGSLHEFPSELMLVNPFLENIRALVAQESVVYREDWLLRRTDWLVDPRCAERVQPYLDQILPDMVARIEE